MFKGAVEYNTEAAEAARKQQEEENETGGGKRHRVKCRDGMNVYMWLPSFDNRPKGTRNPEPLRFLPVHFNPFHVCGRGDSVVSTEDSDELSEDKKFSNCPRCQQAWDNRTDAMESLNLEPRAMRDHPAGKKFSEDMPQQRAALQVIELTAFFKPDASKAFVQPDKKKFEAYWDQFLETITTGVLPEDSDMPDDMKEAALAGVDILLLNKEAGIALYKEHLTKTVENENKSPLFTPEKFLLTIKRGESKDNTFTGRDGKKRYKGIYTPKFSPMSAYKEWSKACKQLVDAVNSKEDFEWKNIYDPAVSLTGEEDEEATLRALASGLVRLSDEQIEAYLKYCKHTFSWQEDLANKKTKASTTTAVEDSIEEEPVSNFNKFSSPDDSEDDEDEEDLQAQLAAFRASASSLVEDEEE